MPRGGIFVHDGIGPVLAFMALHAADSAMDAMQAGAEQVEAYGKANAPWSDITGAARNGLTAEVFQEGMDIVLEFSHSVDYGVWLELIQNGRFAIIMPTLEALGPEIVRAAGGHVVGVEGNF